MRSPQLGKVALRADGGTGHPPYFDSHQEWKDFCNNFRGTAKQIIRSATTLAPLPALEGVAAALPRALATAADAGLPAAKRHLAMETFVLTLESVVPAACELAVAQQQARTACCRQLFICHNCFAIIVSSLLFRHNCFVMRWFVCFRVRGGGTYPTSRYCRSLLRRSPALASGMIPGWVYDLLSYDSCAIGACNGRLTRQPPFSSPAGRPVRHAVRGTAPRVRHRVPVGGAAAAAAGNKAGGPGGADGAGGGGGVIMLSLQSNLIIMTLC